MFSRIVVAVGDGSDADRLEAAAGRLAAGTDAEVLLVHVADRQVCCGGSDDPALHQHDDLLRRLVENLGGRGSRPAAIGG